MAFVIFAMDKGWVMSTFMAFVTWVETFSQHVSCVSEVPEACAPNA